KPVKITFIVTNAIQLQRQPENCDIAAQHCNRPQQLTRWRAASSFGGSNGRSAWSTGAARPRGATAANAARSPLQSGIPDSAASPFFALCQSLDWHTCQMSGHVRMTPSGKIGPDRTG